ncbi:MAG TPA: vanadium-dependent haloperoxidase, partial [Tepidisphaeraceae bacterium]
DVTPFVIKRGDQFKPPAPPKITSKQFTDDFARLQAIGASDSTTRTADQTQIALFWADGAGTATPPGHWNVIAQEIGAARHNTLAENARMLAMLDAALADAGIAAWDAKFTYNYVRPVTAIRNAADDGNPATQADPNWTPLIVTPPFPSYVSGHSTFSAAAAAALAGFFGTDRITFTSTSDAMPGVTRTFTRLSDAAAEAGISRIYGGIHWDFDNQAGLALGKALGRYVAKRFGGGGERHGHPDVIETPRPCAPGVFAPGKGAKREVEHAWD